MVADSQLTHPVLLTSPEAKKVKQLSEHHTCTRLPQLHVLPILGPPQGRRGSSTCQAAQPIQEPIHYPCCYATSCYH